MTRIDKLIHDLRSLLPAIEGALSGTTLVQVYERELLAISDSCAKVRQVFLEVASSQVAKRHAMKKLASDQTALEANYNKLLSQLSANRRQEFNTQFENFDQKTNQLFNILSTVLKNEKEMQNGITRNML